MILPLNMAFTACPIRIDVESSSCLIIYHVNVISSLTPELLFRMVKALIHFIVSFYLLISTWSFIFVYTIVFIFIKLSETMTCACVLRRIYWDFLSEWIYISVNVPQILPGGICDIFFPHATPVQFIIKICQIYQKFIFYQPHCPQLHCLLLPPSSRHLSLCTEPSPLSYFDSSCSFSIHFPPVNHWVKGIAVHPSPNMLNALRVPLLLSGQNQDLDTWPS